MSVYVVWMHVCVYTHTWVFIYVCILFLLWFECSLSPSLIYWFLVGPAGEMDFVRGGTQWRVMRPDSPALERVYAFSQGRILLLPFKGILRVVVVTSGLTTHPLHTKIPFLFLDHTVILFSFHSYGLN